MIVVYSSNSIENISRLEFDLIDYNADWSDNAIAGGGGNYGWPPYYLYLVRKHL
jgi:hypothetical protein